MSSKTGWRILLICLYIHTAILLSCCRCCGCVPRLFDDPDRQAFAFTEQLIRDAAPEEAFFPRGAVTPHHHGVVTSLSGLLQNISSHVVLMAEFQANPRGVEARLGEQVASLRQHV